MSTRCIIGVQKDNDMVEYIYCHHDGYPDRILPLLSTYYNTKESIEELFKYGDLSSLSVNINSCTFYHRDKNEDWNTCKPFILPLNEYLKDEKQTHIEYCYLYNNEWQCVYIKNNKKNK
jgi:hypothetical protein